MCYYTLWIPFFNWSFPLHDDHCKQRLLHQLHSLSSTPHFFMRQRIASDTTYADFVWNDQIDDFINFCSEYLL